MRNEKITNSEAKITDLVREAIASIPVSLAETTNDKDDTFDNLLVAIPGEEMYYLGIKLAPKDSGIITISADKSQIVKCRLFKFSI